MVSHADPVNEQGGNDLILATPIADYLPHPHPSLLSFILLALLLRGRSGKVDFKIAFSVQVNLSFFCKVESKAWLLHSRV